ncbi:MAG: hypothetical protein E7812_06300 [Phenylobacterium sp.]|nr:MAG: hypothetical protein E7812_06300 [Phenylobacterium sp.]
MNRAAVAVVLALSAALATSNAQSQPAPAPTPAVTNVGANLNITPKRLTFDRARRSATVYIYNQGNQPATFDIALVDRVMLQDGQIITVNDADAAAKPIVAQLKSAKDLLLVSPRRATLAPGQGQTIRLRIGSVPADAAGEYRTHLTVTTIPPPSAGVSAEAAAAGGRGELSFQINAVFGISIPAIVRFSDPDPRAAIENAHIEQVDMALDGKTTKRTPVMVFDLTRQGTSSLFGNIEVRGRNQKEALGFARGLGVYTEIAKRTVRIPLTREPGSGEKLEITFTDDDTSPGKLLAKLDM